MKLHSSLANFFLLTTAQAVSIAIGTVTSITDSSNTAVVAWTYGNSQCTFEFLAYNSDSPCGQKFALTDGLEGFQLAGCGGSLWIEHAGAWYSNCHADTEYLGWCTDPDNTHYSGYMTQTYVCD